MARRFFGLISKPVKTDFKSSLRGGMNASAAPLDITSDLHQICERRPRNAHPYAITRQTAGVLRR